MRWLTECLSRRVAVAQPTSIETTASDHAK
jgi:hypothetical protein